MKRVKKRTVITTLLVVLLIVGVAFYVVKLAADGSKWVAFSGNQTDYNRGVLSVGTIVDRNGAVLAGVSGDGTRTYADNKNVRIATLHAVGDPAGNIATGALSKFADNLIGYNFITGAYSANGKGKTVTLTIDSSLNVAAYQALNGRFGTIGIMNYKTGEILCMVSSPSYDPKNPPTISDSDPKYQGVYINRFLSSTFTPGSIFKLVTTAAAIEHIPDISDQTFDCTGSLDLDGGTITCPTAHGQLSFEDALAVSCNCTFAQISLQLGAQTIDTYASNFGLLSSQNIDGIKTAAGNFDIAPAGSANLGWSGVGQYDDLVNPASMLRFVGAIANDGVAVDMQIKKKSPLASLLPAGKTRILKASTAETMQRMMGYNVQKTYGVKNFPGLDIYAKSGTAEVGGGQSPHSWFVGFIKNNDYPLAFVVLVENGGSGAAASAANKVLQAAIKTDLS